MDSDPSYHSTSGSMDRVMFEPSGAKFLSSKHIISGKMQTSVNNLIIYYEPFENSFKKGDSICLNLMTSRKIDKEGVKF